MEIFYIASALGVALIGACFDIWTYRVPNRLTYPAMITGVLLHAFITGIREHSVLAAGRGLGLGLLGLLLGGGVFIIFYLLRTMGAGDIKLMAAVGAFAGPREILTIALACAIAGGVFALLIALYRGKLRTTLANMGDLLRFHAVMGTEIHPTLNLESSQSNKLPYAVPIAAGVLYSLITVLR